MRNIFSIDNIFFRFMARLSDLILLNFLWIIFSLPIVTIGASTTALFSISLKLASDNEEYIFKEFIDSFKKNFKKSSIAWIIILAISIILIVNLIFWPRFQSLIGYFTTTLIMFLIFIFLIITPYIFPILSKYEVTLKDIIKFSALLSIKYLPYSLVIIILEATFFIIPIIFPLTIFFMIFIGISLHFYIASYLFNNILNKYEHDIIRL